MKKIQAQNRNHVSFFCYGFSLPELLVTVVILSVIAAVGIPGFFYLVRRARVQSVALEVAGWLEQVRNSAANAVTADDQAGGCEVEFVEGEWEEGEILASVDSGCGVLDQDLVVPPEVQQDSVGLSVETGPNPIIFTPRGLWINDSGNPGPGLELTISLNNSLPVRCVRLSPALGTVEIGRPPNSGASTCDNWQTL